MNSELIAAAEAGDLAQISILLAGGADINQRDSRGRTAVLAATHAKQVEAVRTLIEAGADLDLQDERRDNVLLYAGAEGLLEIVRLAIQAGANPRITNRYGGVALIPACERGHLDVVRELLNTSDVEVNHVNNLGWTALMEAIVLSNGGPVHQEIIRLLIEAGADVNIPDKEGVSALRHAQARGFREIVAMLEGAGGR
ncbi:MAG: hypothetical protein BGO01_11170 [Armatimonadetes bacterium 55-13]|nr:ankyrin repeat domain-containing protein [Armatimonadota bacterium]OJU63180.1 MAG: hypothetical protein BGO01_11170 [Armatimonadetes bacterium 55-13]